MKVKDLFGMEMPPPYERGTVAYHEHYAAWYRRNRRMYLPIIGLSLLMIVINAEGWIGAVSSLVYAAVLFAMGMRWWQGRTDEQRSRAAAWQVETSETVQAMATSGLYASPLDVLDSIRSGPVPPGWKRKDWVEMHNDLEVQLRKQMEDNPDGPWHLEP